MEYRKVNLKEGDINMECRRGSNEESRCRHLQEIPDFLCHLCVGAQCYDERQVWHTIVSILIEKENGIE